MPNGEIEKVWEHFKDLEESMDTKFKDVGDKVASLTTQQAVHAEILSRHSSDSWQIKGLLLGVIASIVVAILTRLL